MMMSTKEGLEIFTLTYAMTEDTSEETLTALDVTTRSSVAAVEEILQYRFRNKSLIEEALTHSSHTEAPSYQRLEFVGDAALGLAVANFVFITYPGIDPGQLSLLRAANISTEKLARVAVRHGLYKFLRHNAPSLDVKVREFALAVEEEGDEIPYAGAVKAPKVLADIVESIAAAVYVDCNFDLKLLWKYFSRLLEPIVTLENLEQQPVTMLYELCQKQGKHVNIKHWRKGLKNIASVYVDGKLVGSGCSEQKDIAKINAAKEALEKLCSLASLPVEDGSSGRVNDIQEIDGAKQKLNELCNKKRWPKPSYKVEKEVGPAHERRFVCSVQIETVSGTFLTSGDIKSKVKDAENSAASMMLRGLEDPKFGLGNIP
ncbi:Ribonuclease III domain [Macleaya cordata]|uniref:Ribonuclease III domain n=1 Tax=Macleaya cordata TaxID=56857 RepID=A0A200QH30_MACCD|nr:Ribonuclease III domain [Macleaya cordata]